jgi:nitroimidazol reductase NimA-like FMN-containing flavoprotein (pyridoxamine 5'-phosphate oxidase superfamily)
MTNFTPTERTRVRRKPDRGTYDRELIYRILDEAFVCHVAFVVDGQPFVVPTNYVRVGDKLFLHGSIASRLMKTLATGAPFCLSVTLLDGIVLSPTATGHSVNYRSVVVMGKAQPVEGEAAKLAAMRDFVEYVIRGRWAAVRPPQQAGVARHHGSCRAPRGGFRQSARRLLPSIMGKNMRPPRGPESSPMKWTAETPVPDPRGNPASPIPPNVLNYSRPQ